MEWLRSSNDLESLEKRIAEKYPMFPISWSNLFNHITRDDIHFPCLVIDTSEIYKWSDFYQPQYTVIEQGDWERSLSIKERNDKGRITEGTA